MFLQLVLSCPWPLAPLTPAEIYKKNGDTYMTLKAYNGRCVLTWLSETVYQASQQEEFASKDERVFLIAGALTLDGDWGLGSLPLSLSIGRENEC